ALRGGQGAALVRAVEGQYRAALVDEFQDTDKVQYEIFQRLFDRPPMMLFMIGDPKQAIYSFRGADLFSYLKAAQDADRSATLTRNWRSTPSLVESVNLLFESHPYPFGFEQIQFHPATAARPGASPVPFPLTIWYLTRTNGKAPSKPLNQSDAVGTIAEAVAEEVVRLLITPQERTAPRQIAVLTRTHAQSQIIKHALSKKRVPAVLHSAGSVFDTGQADGLLRVLEAVADPHDPGKVRAALAQDMFGWQAGDFHDAMNGGDERWRKRWASFYHDYRIWLQRGIYPMLRSLMARERVRSRMLSRPDGERALTNLLHLAELLHEAESEHGLGPEGVVNWLVEQRQSAQEGDERQLRLESDADAVRIITMHKSKGLQFDVVFCPFTWSGVRMNKEAVVFHDGSDENRLILRLGPDIPFEDQLQAGKELLAENLRMLYVALTRARERCYLAWGRINGTEMSAPAYLFHGRQSGGDQTDWMAPLTRKMKSLSDAELIRELGHLSRRSGGSIRIAPLIQPTDLAYENPTAEKRLARKRNLRRTISGYWPMTSFSSLTAAAPDTEKAPDDRDMSAGDAPSQNRESEEFDSLFDFPKGARAGLFFHDLLEHWDHAGGRYGRQEELIRSKLQAHGFDDQWHPALNRFLGHLSAKQLSAPGNEFSLSQVKMEHRINEMEFYFPLKGFTSEQIKTCFQSCGHALFGDAMAARLERIHFAPEKGVLKGFIDTVIQYDHQYFLIDWKSNHLGYHPAFYDGPMLDKCMVGDDYFLQYHLYAVALSRLLAQKIAGYRYERHFGGVFYIFLRGITAEPSERSGLFFDRPGGSLISALDDLMIKKG
ncbi:MAG: UvrD-helicase domain-containing protein, partial [Desulfobacteraceae bacterium]